MSKNKTSLILFLVCYFILFNLKSGLGQSFQLFNLPKSAQIDAIKLKERMLKNPISLVFVTEVEDTVNTFATIRELNISEKDMITVQVYLFKENLNDKYDPLVLNKRVSANSIFFICSSSFFRSV